MCLENRLPATAREFESHTLRHFFGVRMTVLTLFRLCLSWQVQNEHFAQPDTDIQAYRNQKSVCFFTAEGENRYAAEKTDKRLGNRAAAAGRKRADRCRIWVAAGGLPTQSFLFVDAVSGGFLKNQKSHPFTKYLRFFPRLSSLLRTDGVLFFWYNQV